MELEDGTLSVVCGDLTGLLLLENFSARRECVSCEHGLVKPATFERLAGKGHCKSWKRTVRCGETGKDLLSLIEAGTLQLLDEPEWLIKKRESAKLIKSKLSELDLKGPPKRKRGRPKKSGSSLSINKDLSVGESQVPQKMQNQLSDSSLVDNVNGAVVNGAVDQSKLNGKLANGQIRKRKKLRGCNESPNTAKANKSTKSNGSTHGSNGVLSQINGLEQPSTGHEVYKRVPRHGKCKRKRVRHNEFERSVNAIVRDRKAPSLNMRMVCPVCKALVPDADALKYHDMMFHSSVSSKLFMSAEELAALNEENNLQNGNGVDSSLDFSHNSFFETEPSDSDSTKDFKFLPSLDVFKDKLTRGTVAKLASIGMGRSITDSSDCPSSSKQSSSAVDCDQLSLLSSIAMQYQEILGISKDTLRQTRNLQNRMEVLAKSVEEIKSEVKDLSKTLALANMAKSAVRDDITAGDYQTFFNILEKFLNSNGYGVSR